MEKTNVQVKKYKGEDVDVDITTLETEDHIGHGHPEFFATRALAEARGSFDPAYAKRKRASRMRGSSNIARSGVRSFEFGQLENGPPPLSRQR